MAGVALAPLLLHAILVAPHAVFIDDRVRTAQVYLVNTGKTPEEVSIDLKYGYPATDSAGNISVPLFDSVPAGEPSAAEWIKAYPRRLVVGPGQRQVVRLLATPPANLVDGEYWARLIATSRGARVAIATGDSGVTAGVSIELRTVISVSYRKGQLTTGVRLTDFSASATRDSLILWLGTERQGNAAFLGSVNLVLSGAKGQTRRWDSPLAVYHALRRRYAFPLDSLPAGRYTLRLDLTTARDDLDQSNVLPAEAVTRQLDVQVP
jgi:hypothetical protein